MNSNIFDKKHWIVAIVAIAVVGVAVQYRYMNEFPAFIHSWSQTDRYSIAIGFLNNDFDLFHPETLIYNKQFPHWWKTDSGSTITSVDLPLMEYIVATIMKLTGNTQPWIFRLCTFLASLTAVWFIYLLGRRLGGHWLKGLLVAMVAITSPVFTYYANVFIPSIPAIAFSSAALWLYSKHLNNGSKTKYFNLSVLMLTLSVLVRMSLAVVLVAVLAFEFLRFLRKETSLWNKVPATILSAIAILSYMLWNKYLREMYDTMFLSGLMPADSLGETIDLLKQAADNWKYQYFSQFQQYILATVAIAAIGFGIYRRCTNICKQTSMKHKPLSLWWLWALCMIGYTMFVIVMVKQAPDHDYYFLDTLFLPTLLLLMLLLKATPNIPNKVIATAMVFILIGTATTKMTVDVAKNQKVRRDYNDRSYQTAQNYQGAEEFLDTQGVPHDAKILALYAYPQNTPFILMNRKGYTEMWYDEDIIEAGLYTFDYDYIVIENDRYRKEFDYHRKYLNRLQRIADNGKIALCRYTDTVVCITADDFFEHK